MACSEPQSGVQFVRRDQLKRLGSDFPSASHAEGRWFIPSRDHHCRWCFSERVQMPCNIGSDFACRTPLVGNGYDRVRGVHEVMVWPERERWAKPAPVVVEPAKPEPVKPSTTLTYCQCCDGLKYEWRMDWSYGAYQCDRCRGVLVLSVKQKAKQVGTSS